MEAAVIQEFGDVDVLHLEEVATPSPRPGHILIKVLAAGINRLDHYIRQGSIAPELPFPHILGADAVGEVAEIGEGVTGFKVGDRGKHRAACREPGDAANGAGHRSSSHQGSR